jgi:hypothetical protein
LVAFQRKKRAMRVVSKKKKSSTKGVEAISRGMRSKGTLKLLDMARGT